jgi:tetratricopeptide (TPR) repeat protein
VPFCARARNAGKAAAATLAALFLFGCQTGSQADELGPSKLAQVSNGSSSGAASTSGAATPLPESASGAYLAAQAAFADRDMATAADFLLTALASDPDNKDLLRQAHFALVSAGRIADALPLARKLVQGEPSEQLSPLTLAVDAIDRNDMDAATDALNKVPLSGYNQTLVPLFEAWVDVGKGDSKGALAAIGPYDLGDGFDAFRAYHVALIEELAGDAAAADAAFRVALTAQEGGSYRVVLAYGAFLQRQGRGDDARAVYDDFLKANQDSLWLENAYAALKSGTPPEEKIDTPREGAAEALFAVAGASQQSGSPEMALAYARLAAYLEPDSDVVSLLVGDILEAEKRTQDAIEAYRHIGAKSPLSWTARLRTAIDLDDAGSTDQAVSLLRQMVEERPARADALVVLGDILRVNERWDEAIDAYNEAYEREGDAAASDWKLLYVRGIALERAGRWDLAEKDLLAALKLQPDHPYVLNYLGYTWVDKGEKLGKALAMIQRAVDQRPDDGFIVDSLGWAYFRMGRYQDAVAQLEHAVELEPGDAVINDHLGDAYWRAGRRSEARYQWRQALAFITADDDPKLAGQIEAKLQAGLPPLGGS